MKTFSRSSKGLLLGVSLLALASRSLFAGEVVTICADSWMPYNGDPSSDKPGYVVELANKAFALSGLEVNYSTMPWDDTLAAVREGKVNGAICVSDAEAEGMVLPKTPIGAARMIMLTRADSTWEYSTLRSIKDVRIGVIEDYAYWDVMDSYIAKSGSEAVYVAAGETPLDDLMAKLDSGEIDVVIDSEAVIVWKLRERGQTRDDYRAVYRHVPDNLFIGFSATEEGRRLAFLFDKGMKQLAASGESDRIAAAYGLKNWH